MYCDLLTKAFQAVCDKFEVVASASSAPEILQLINEHRPKVVVLSDSLEEGPNTGLNSSPKFARPTPKFESCWPPHRPTATW